MSDYVEMEHEGWFGRLGNALKGIVVGIVLFVASFPLLAWNEGRAVKTARSLAEGAAAVVSVASDTVASANDGKLVHMTGKAVTDAVLKDDLFGVADQAIKLRRAVEMYQWKETVRTETRKKVGGGKVRTKHYSYSRVWSDDVINSSRFKQAGHENPGRMPFDSKTVVADDVRLGAFRLSDGLVAKVGGFESLPVNASHLAGLSDSVRAGLQIDNGVFYRGESPADPQIGDVRIAFKTARPLDVSILSQQVGASFQPYQTQAGRAIEDLRSGIMSAEQMFDQLETENALLTWGLRLAGFLCMAIGIYLVLNPLGVLADVLPFLGDIVHGALGLFAALVAAGLSLVTIAIAWIVFRPLLGAGLLGVALMVTTGAFMLRSPRQAYR